MSEMESNQRCCQMNRKKLGIILVIVVIVVIVVAAVLGAILGSRKGKSFKGTFLDRCEEYQKKIYRNSTPTIDCKELEDEFDKVMQNKEATCKADDFDKFTQLAITPQMYKNKMTTLWTGHEANKKAMKVFDSGHPYLPIARVLGGYIMGEDRPCEGRQWKSYRLCKECGQEEVEKNFWTSASKRFASLAEGIVNIFLFGSRNPVVRNSSFMISVELPALRKNVVKRVRVFVFDNNCSTSSPDLCQKATVQGILIKKLNDFGFPNNCSSCAALQ